jgi:large subunit ribosomal protein L9
LSDGVTIAHKSGEEGRLFGSVGTVDIARACTEAGVEVSKSELRLPEGPFRVAGEYEVTVHLHTDIDSTLKVIIIGEE